MARKHAPSRPIGKRRTSCAAPSLTVCCERHTSAALGQGQCSGNPAHPRLRLPVASKLAPTGYYCVMTRDRLTIVIAAFNEAESLPLLHPRIAAMLDLLAAEQDVDGQVLYVDDGSSDATWRVMQQLAAADRRVAAAAAVAQLRQGAGADGRPRPGRAGRGADPRCRRPGSAGADPAVRRQMARRLRRRPRHAHGTRGRRLAQAQHRARVLPRDRSPVEDADPGRHRRLPPAVAARADRRCGSCASATAS